VEAVCSMVRCFSAPNSQLPCLVRSSLADCWLEHCARWGAPPVRHPSALAIGQPCVNITLPSRSALSTVAQAMGAICEWSICHHRARSARKPHHHKLARMTSGTSPLWHRRPLADRAQQRPSCSRPPRTARWTRECPARCRGGLAPLTRAIAGQNGPRRCSTFWVAWMR
jgi:hypothetical protein